MDVTLPQLGETVTEGTILRWLKAVGDHVAEDEPLYEVSTDKVDSEVPSPGTGVLTEILVQEGDTALVGARLAVLGEAGSSSTFEGAGSEANSSSTFGTSSSSASEPATAGEPVAAPAPVSAPAAPVEPVAAPVAHVASPLVRKMIRERGLNAASLRGTGPGGRVTREDVERAAAGKGSTGVARVETPVVSIRPAEDQVIPFDRVRSAIAEHMVRSKATSPHVLQFNEVDFESIAQVRAQHGDAFKTAEGFSLTYLPFIARAVCDALSEFPRLNASIQDEALIVHSTVNLGIAVDIHFEGLIVPVIQRAETKTLRQLAREIRVLAERARTKQLNLDDVAGGTFTISNAGPFGTTLTAPIINQPQVAIMSTDGIHKKPVAMESPLGDSIAIHRVGMQALCFDHRANDGAYTAAFLRRYQEIIETRDWAAELA